ncbi:hypothetical protein C8J55DRAFT_485829 [Lentinula edodes]|uniref:Chromatin elongation factor spt5 n=1 Tax=Lentinula lateritia TaxID=40482 RepID=A0A9W9DZX1_9AGAR|nr:hypothetical protein C8J55DRAFT_485829 [Lentinula edodes]
MSMSSSSPHSSKATGFPEFTSNRRAIVRGYLDDEAQEEEEEEERQDAKDDEENDEDLGLDLAGFIDDSATAQHARSQVPIYHHSPPIFSRLIKRYEYEASSSSSSTSSEHAVNFSDSDVGSSNSSSTRECWNVLRAFAVGTITTLPEAEDRLRALIGPAFNFNDWGPKFDAITEPDMDIQQALLLIAEFEAIDASQGVTPAQPSVSNANTGAHCMSELQSNTSAAKLAGDVSILVTPQARNDEDAFVDGMNAIRRHYRDQEEDWHWYLVRCFVGSEGSVVKHLLSASKKIIRDASTSPVAGYVYIQTRSMLPSNLSLALYLKSTYGFIYSHPPETIIAAGTAYPPAAQDPRLELPIHRLVPEYDPPKKRVVQLKRHFPFGTWVRVINNQKLIYSGDVGVIAMPSAMFKIPSGSHLLLLVPRVNLQIRSELDIPDIDDAFIKRSPLCLWDRNQCESVIKITQEEPLRWWCPSCSISDENRCFHEQSNKIVAFRNRAYQSGLALEIMKVTQLEETTNISLNASRLFFDSLHPLLFDKRVLLQIPPPDSWHLFSEGEEVHVLSQAWAHPLASLYQRDGTTLDGVIRRVNGLTCMVLIDGTCRTISTTRLRRKISLGMQVQLSEGTSEETSTMGGRLGLVHEIKLENWTASVMLDKNTMLELDVNSLRPIRAPTIPDIATEMLRPIEGTHGQPEVTKNKLYTERSPWLGINAIIVHPRSEYKGHKCVVQDVDRSEAFRGDGDVKDTTRSGLRLQVEFSTRFTSKQRFAWFDYHWVRHERFLHDDGAHRGIPFGQWAFRPGYSPMYTKEDLQAIQCYELQSVKEVEAQKIAQAEEERRQSALIKTPLHPSSEIHDGSAWDPSSRTPTHSSSYTSVTQLSETSPAPSSSTVQLPTHWIENPLLYHSLTQDLDIFIQKGDKVQRVYLSWDGCSVIVREGQRSNLTKVGSIIAPSLIQQSFEHVPPHPTRARGLFLVIRGEHVGLIGRYEVASTAEIGTITFYLGIPIVTFGRLQWDPSRNTIDASVLPRTYVMTMVSAKRKAKKAEQSSTKAKKLRVEHHAALPASRDPSSPADIGDWIQDVAKALGVTRKGPLSFLAVKHPDMQYKMKIIGGVVEGTRYGDASMNDSITSGKFDEDEPQKREEMPGKS